MISSKTDQQHGSKIDKRKYGKIKNNKSMLKILPFIRILYLKQQSSILQCFRFLGYISQQDDPVHAAEKDQIKYFAQN